MSFPSKHSTPSSYSEKFKDPRWQRRRLEILESSRFKCDRCGDTETTLHVHHKIYRKGKAPWEYSRSDLACLCSTCHDEIHKKQEQLNELIAEVDTPILDFLFDQLIGFVKGFSYSQDRVGYREEDLTEILSNAISAEDIDSPLIPSTYEEAESFAAYLVLNSRTGVQQTKKVISRIKEIRHE